DAQNLMARSVAPIMAAALLANADTKDLGEILASWDHRDRIDSAAPTVFQTTYCKFAERVFGDELGPDLAAALLPIVEVQLPEIYGYHAKFLDIDERWAVADTIENIAGPPSTGFPPQINGEVCNTSQRREPLAVLQFGSADQVRHLQPVGEGETVIRGVGAVTPPVLRCVGMQVAQKKTSFGDIVLQAIDEGDAHRGQQDLLQTQGLVLRHARRVGMRGQANRLAHNESSATMKQISEGKAVRWLKLAPDDPAMEKATIRPRIIQR
ncbi:MAG: penicillin acylase family protein, partial [Desulfobacterales bacterium]|nr:penicillin acylase family protein [Desulfobacterales bacterium]